MKKIKEFLIRFFNPLSILMLVSLFIASFVIGLLTDNFVIALRDAGIITTSMILMIIFIKFIKNFDNE